MLTTDDFSILVPVDGPPRLVLSSSELVSFGDGPKDFRKNRVIALKDNRTVQGSVYRKRDTSASDELHIFELLNSRFREPRVGEHVTLARVDGPGTAPTHKIGEVVRSAGTAWLVRVDGTEFMARNDTDTAGNHLVWIGEPALQD
ncbi:MAG: hypothetical protein JWM95_3272 [Gemmatimonadetes bacterium]|nr:hypothetical protein [Gemmatimonadota bacterium]